MTLRRSLLLIVLIAFVGCTTSRLPRTNSRADLQRYVESAAGLVRTQGLASCDAFKQPAWMGGDYYIFVTELDSNITRCHPLRADLVGQNQDMLQDSTGKYIAQEMRRAAMSSAGNGWVEYLWPRPGQTQPVPKSTYVMAVTGPDGKRYIVGSGGYQMP